MRNIKYFYNSLRPLLAELDELKLLKIKGAINGNYSPYSSKNEVNKRCNYLYVKASFLKTQAMVELKLSNNECSKVDCMVNSAL